MACHLGSELASKGFKPDGFVLEAPFNRMLDQVMTDSKAQFLSHRGLVDFPILLKEIRMEFDSQVWPINTVFDRHRLKKKLRAKRSKVRGIKSVYQSLVRK